VQDIFPLIGLLAASGAIEAEAALFGSPVMLTLCGVVGCHISGTVNTFCSSTDVVLAITKVPCCSRFIVFSLLSHYIFIIVCSCCDESATLPDISQGSVMTYRVWIFVFFLLHKLEKNMFVAESSRKRNVKTGQNMTKLRTRV